MAGWFRQVTLEHRAMTMRWYSEQSGQAPVRLFCEISRCARNDKADDRALSFRAERGISCLNASRDFSTPNSPRHSARKRLAAFRIALLRSELPRCGVFRHVELPGTLPPNAAARRLNHHAAARSLCLMTQPQPQCASRHPAARRSSPFRSAAAKNILLYCTERRIVQMLRVASGWPLLCRR